MQSERYQERPIYERDAFEVYEEFYSGKPWFIRNMSEMLTICHHNYLGAHPDDKEWLLLNGTNHISEDEEGDEEEEAPVQIDAGEPGADAAKETIINKPIPLPPVKVSLVLILYISPVESCQPVKMCCKV